MFYTLDIYIAAAYDQSKFLTVEDGVRKVLLHILLRFPTSSQYFVISEVHTFMILC